MLRNDTYEVKIGNIYIGKGHKIAIQSMCNIKTSKVDEVVSQILELENEGCDLIRVSILDEEDAYSLKEIVSRIHIPLIADIHFSSKLAKLSIINGASKIRLNPGNLKDENTLRDVIKTLSNMTNKPVSKDKEDKIIDTILKNKVPSSVDKMF